MIAQHPGEFAMPGQGSTGNVIAAVCSFFIPGLGQLVQGRVMMALVMFVLAALLWFIFMGWLVHLWSIIDAAVWRPKA
jgi:TM2 domain-containing membrane protein YozV